ncbi:plastocyanin/azurin family copper-binding protein, partial [Chromatiaceae bacterium AAb-1]|nr:plastocyanin/azurin family copper-binding protein [Chromatiaceae bacterium AAb-1]
MTIRSSLLFTALLCFGSQALANECEFTLESNDAMQFNHKEITVSKACDSFTLTLKHVGKLPKNVMGHNWALSKASDLSGILADGAKAGLDNHYLKPA